MTWHDLFALRKAVARRADGRFGAVAAVALLGCALLAAQANAQSEAPPPPGGTPAAGTRLYSPEQLDQLLAPVALYPDDLLGQMLMAATYPLEIVQADRWLQDSNNASLGGSALAQALQQLPWDPSVKSLVAYPQILAWMDSALDWTEAVGDAFLAQQPEVMDSVQRLRGRAQAAGTLSSTPQQTVMTSDQAIQIASPDTGVMYVPLYSPDAAYGPWPYSDYPPYDFGDPGYGVGAFIAFPILVPYWGWDHWDWRHHRINVDSGKSGAGPGAAHPVPWRHDPMHRAGVPYRDPVTRAKFEGYGDTHSVHSNFRGYPSGSQVAPSNRPAPIAPAAHAAPAVRPEPIAPPPHVATAERPAPRPEAQRPAPVPRPAPALVERPMPPALESFGTGAEVHVQEQRGASSRVSPPATGGGGGHR